MAAVALVVRLAFTIALAAGDAGRSLSSDSRQYVALAAGFGDAYGVGQADDGLAALSVVRPPGYPALLWGVFSLFGRRAVPVLVIQSLLGAAMAVGTAVLARRLVGPGAAVVAGLVVAVDPASVVYANHLLSETLFTALVLAGILAAVTPPAAWRPLGWAAVGGGLVGAAALVRPIGMYLPIAVAVAVVVWTKGSRRDRLGPAVAVLVAAAVPIGAWTARNVAVADLAALTTLEAENLLSYRAAGAVRAERDVSLDEARSELDRELRRRLPAGAGAAERAGASRRLAIEVLRDHPAGAVESTASGAAAVLLGPGRQALFRLAPLPAGPARHGATAIVTAMLAVELLAAAAGSVLLARRRPRAAVVLVLLVAYFVVLPAGPEGNARFRVPAVPYLAVLAGAAWASVASRQGPGPPGVLEVEEPPPHGGP